MRRRASRWQVRHCVVEVDNRSEVREFLTSRRAKTEQAGVPQIGQRRVPGLRRSEVAALAGMSVVITPSWNAANSAAYSEQVSDQNHPYSLGSYRHRGFPADMGTTRSLSCSKACDIALRMTSATLVAP